MLIKWEIVGKKLFSPTVFMDQFNNVNDFSKAL